MKKKKIEKILVGVITEHLDALLADLESARDEIERIVGHPDDPFDLAMEELAGGIGV